MNAWSFGKALILLAGVMAVLVPALDDAGEPTAAASPQSVVATYQTQIHPILATKCAACHTATPERPLHYSIPVVSYWSQPLIEDHIRRGRVQFDFTDGFPMTRVGAAHEFVARLRDSVRDQTMPPTEYAVVHWNHRLTEAERKTILDWAEAAITALNTVRTTREAAALDSPDAPEQIAAAIVKACPLAHPKDARARDAC